MYALCRINALVSAYEVCVCEWRGAPCTHSTFIEMAPRPVSVAGPMELLPPHTQADLGMGGQLMGRELGPRDHVTCHMIAWPSHVTIPGQRGGGPTAS